MSYLMEMHAHTSETSRCANVKAEKMISEYIKAGYDGIVITDHFSPSTFEIYEKDNLCWNDKVDIFLKGYRTALNAAGGKINVLLGMELRFDNPNSMNDYLVYGLNEKFLYNNPQILDMNLRDFSVLAHNNKMIIFQAHPFRYGMKVSNPKYLNGVETRNKNPRHESNNDIAAAWAEKYHLLTTSGSDYHEIEDLAGGGIYFDNPIYDNRTLVKELLRGNYTLK